jgi:4'-phosphopantetheinyl transferase EntD
MSELRSAIRALFDGDVAVTVWEGDHDPGPSPDEPATLARAVPSRVLEFRRGRACARAALEELGCPRSSIPVGPDREPIWPAGFVGSITHCADLVAAVAAKAGEIEALGLDGEPAKPLPSEVRRLVLHPAERPKLLAGGLDTVVFCAKEAIFKALFPLVRTTFGFADVIVDLDGRSRTFAARPSANASVLRPHLTLLRGRFAIAAGFVLTGCLVGAPSAGGRQASRAGRARREPSRERAR